MNHHIAQRESDRDILTDVLGYYDRQPGACRVTCASLSRLQKRPSRASCALKCDGSHRRTGYVCLLLLSSFTFLALLWRNCLPSARLFLVSCLQPTAVLHIENASSETRWISNMTVRSCDEDGGGGGGGGHTCRKLSQSRDERPTEDCTIEMMLGSLHYWLLNHCPNRSARIKESSRLSWMAAIKMQSHACSTLCRDRPDTCTTPKTYSHKKPNAAASDVNKHQAALIVPNSGSHVLLPIYAPCVAIWAIVPSASDRSMQRCGPSR